MTGSSECENVVLSQGLCEPFHSTALVEYFVNHEEATTALNSEMLLLSFFNGLSALDFGGLKETEEQFTPEYSIWNNGKGSSTSEPAIVNIVSDLHLIIRLSLVYLF